MKATASDPAAVLESSVKLQSFHLTGSVRTLAAMSANCDANQTHADIAMSAYVGRAWISGWSRTGPTYMHLKSPNTHNCHFVLSGDQGDLPFTPSSNHSGGVNVLMGDGRVDFVQDGVEPRIWWALGSRNGADLAGEL